MSGGFTPPGAPRVPHHPFAGIFPMMSDAERDELGDDMASNGQAETVKIFAGMILDGRNREDAAFRKGIGYRWEEFTGTPREALNWIISKNLKRRHLTESQRAMVAARLSKFSVGDNQFSRREPAQICAPSLLPPPASPEVPPVAPLSQTERADTLSVSRRLVQHAETVAEQGAPELQRVVEEGALAVSAAVDIAARPAEEQKALLDSLPRDSTGKLTPEAKKEIRKVAKEVRAEDQAEKKKKRAAKERELSQKILALPGTKAGLILSDFEWDFKVRSRETGMDRHASNHYVTAADCDTPEEIVERQRERMSVAAPDCIHMMWVPAAFSAIGHKVMELQGFRYVSQVVWIKTGIGTGFWFRECHELLFFGVRGKIPCPAMGDQFKSAIEAPRGDHSVKPDFQYEIAEKYFETLPKIELNARRTRPGWIAWGNEAPNNEAEQPQREAAE